MNMIFAIAAGGAAGSVLRYLSGRAAVFMFGDTFPYGTLFVNIFGCFLMGLCAGFFAQSFAPSPEMKAFILIGVLGGFTTFSSFSLDALTLYERGHAGAAVVYVFISVLFSISAVVAGFAAVRSIT